MARQIVSREGGSDNLLSTSVVVAVLGVSPRTLSRWQAEGRLRPVGRRRDGQRLWAASEVWQLRAEMEAEKPRVTFSSRAKPERAGARGCPTEGRRTLRKGAVLRAGSLLRAGAYQVTGSPRKRQ